MRAPTPAPLVVSAGSAGRPQGGPSPRQPRRSWRGRRRPTRPSGGSTPTTKPSGRRASCRRCCSGARRPPTIRSTSIFKRRRSTTRASSAHRSRGSRSSMSLSSRPRGTRSSTRTRATPSRFPSSSRRTAVAYGPLTETWIIAQGTLTGTVYYNSYGTALAINYHNTTAGLPNFGGATLAIKHGATSPVLVAGSSVPGASPFGAPTSNTASSLSYCRVCHSVAAGGSTARHPARRRLRADERLRAHRPATPRR